MIVILWYPQMNVGNLHVRVTSEGPSLTIRDHSHAQSVIPTIHRRGYYFPPVNVEPCQHLSSIIDGSLKITPSFLGGSIL